VRQADLILLLEGGRIVERGTYESLMMAGGLYYEMVIRQIEAQREEHEGDILLSRS
jgi:ATP-binding cassette subfamily B protein